MHLPDVVIEHASEVVWLIAMGASFWIFDWLKTKLKDWFEYRRLHPLARSLNINKAVQTLLIELRAKLNADRAYICQFHNGQSFSSQNPIWRISRTQEICAPGVAPEIEHTQGTLASLVWESLLPLVNPGEKLPTGCMRFIKLGSELPLNIYVFKIREVDASYFKSKHLASGTTVVLTCPLVDSRKQVIGYVGLNYHDEHNVPLDLSIVYDYAAQLYYTLIKVEGE